MLIKITNISSSTVWHIFNKVLLLYMGLTNYYVWCRTTDKVETVTNPRYFQPCSGLVSNKVAPQGRSFHMGYDTAIIVGYRLLSMYTYYVSLIK